jgi:Na+/H+-dicarboxylate symporter
MGFLRAYRLPLALLAGIAAGTVAGAVAGSSARVVAPLGDLFLNLLFTIVVPLVFFSVAGAVANMSSLGRLGRIASRMLAVFFLGGVVAALLALLVVLAIPPAEGVRIVLPEAGEVEALTVTERIVRALSAPDFTDLLSRRSILALIVFASLFGVSVLLVGERGKPVARGMAVASDVLQRMTTLVMWFGPVGLGAWFAALVGEHGTAVVGGYVRAVGTYYPLSFLYFGVFFTLYAWIAARGPGVRALWRAIPTPAATAFASGSSVASIPANLEASRTLGVPRDVRELVVPVGATIHMEGSAISAVFKIAFLFGVFGRSFAEPDVLVGAVGVALMSAVVMSGIPGGGFIGEMMIISMYGFPPEALPLLAVFGTLIDPPATMINSAGDTVSGMLVARWTEGPGWFGSRRSEAPPG